MPLPSSDDLLEFAKSLGGGIKALPEAPEIFKDEKAPSVDRIEQLKKEADAAGKRWAAERAKKDGLDRLSNAAHGRISTLLSQFDKLKIDPGEGHRAPPKEWYDDAFELQRLENQLAQQEKAYQGQLQHYADAISYSHFSRQYLSDQMAAANRQTAKVYFRTDLELAAVQGVTWALKFLGGGKVPGLVLGPAKDWADSKIKEQRGGEKDKKEEKSAAEKTANALGSAGEQAEKVGESAAKKGLGRSLLDKALGESQSTDDLAQKIGLGANQEPGNLGKALGAASKLKDGVEVYDDTVKLKEEFDKLPPQLSLTGDSEKSFSDLSKDVDGLPDGVQKQDLKNAISNAKDGFKAVDDAKKSLLEQAIQYSRAIEMIAAFKVSWSKPKK